MAEEKAGIVAALDDLGATAEPDQVDEQQLAMFGSGPLGENEHARGLPGVKTRGRPKGAKNRSTEEWREFFLSQRRSPVMCLLDIATMPLEALKERLGPLAKGETKLDLLKLQVAAASAAAPYVHQKLPQAVKLEGTALPILLLGGEIESIEGGQIKTLEGEFIEFLEHEENQRVSENGDEKSAGAKSADDNK